MTRLLFLVLTPMLLAAASSHAEIAKVSVVSVFVTDIERAKAWYTEKLGFEVAEDMPFGEGERWLTLRPKGNTSLRLLLRLGKPVGHQPRHPERPEVIFDTVTDDLPKTAAELKARGVEFFSEPTCWPWGTFEAMVVDPDGQGIAVADSKPCTPTQP